MSGKFCRVPLLILMYTFLCPGIFSPGLTAAESSTNASDIVQNTEQPGNSADGHTGNGRRQIPGYADRRYALDTNLLFNELVMGGSFHIKTDNTQKVRVQRGFADVLSLSYDYTQLLDSYTNFTQEDLRGKAKSLWKISYHLTWKNIPYIDVTYHADQNLDVYNTFLVSGLGKQFDNGLKIEGGLGYKRGNTDLQQERYDVLNVLLGYQSPVNDSDVIVRADVKAYMPRKYLTDNMFEGLWIVDGRATIELNRKFIGVKPALGISFRRDYYPVQEETHISYAGLLHYNLTLGFNLDYGLN